MFPHSMEITAGTSTNEHNRAQIIEIERKIKLEEEKLEKLRGELSELKGEKKQFRARGGSGPYPEDLDDIFSTNMR